MKNSLKNLITLNHPLVEDKLARMRDENTPHADFQRLLEDISIFLFYEGTKSLATADSEVKTPLETTAVKRVKNDILLVPVLRAGLGMSNGIVKFCKHALTGMIGMYRDHDTLQPIDYYLRLPDDISEMDIFLLDPMLATGGSANESLHKLKRHGAKNLSMLCLLAAPEGVALLEKEHPDVKVYTAALDRQLNSIGYILPGLGDAGDRYFGV